MFKYIFYLCVFVALSSCLLNPGGELDNIDILDDLHPNSIYNEKLKAKKLPRSAKIGLALRAIPDADVSTESKIYKINDRWGQGSLMKKPVQLTYEEAIIVGIAVDSKAESAAHSVWIDLNDGEYIPANYGGASVQFGKTKGNPAYERVAFRLVIPNRKLVKGENTIKVVIVGKDKAYKYTPQHTYTIIKGIQS